MFDPEDNKRTAVRRASIDLGSKETGAPLRSRRSAGAGGSARVARNASELLDRLSHSAAKPQAARSGEGKQPEPQPAKDAAKKKTSRFAGWFGRGKIQPAQEARKQNDPTAYSPAEKSQAYGEQQDRPLIDLATILTSVWQVRRLILALTVVGAIGGVVLAASTPSVYVAQSKLYVDPREVRLTDSDLSKESLATEAILALVDSQLEVLRSRTVLEKVAIDMGLDRDPEFGAAVTGKGGLAAGIEVIRDLVSPGKAQPVPASGVNPRTLEKLSDAVAVSRDPKTFIVTIEVKSRDPAKSALIANRLVATFLNEEQAAQSGFFQRTTAALDSRLTDLRKELDTAENAVEKYKADHDIVGAAGELISDKQLLALNDQVGAVRSRIADARSKADVVTKTQLNDVLSGAFPEEVSSVTLQELRKQYSQARAQLGSLDASLGPRHPQRLAAVQSLEVARSEIGNELRRIEATAQTELDRAIRTEKDLVQQLAVQKAQQVNSSTGFIELRELERKANATRMIYESFLKRASETGQEEKLTSKNIRVISSAQPPLQAKGPSRKLIAIGGLIAGFMAGVGLGIALGAYRSVKDLLQRSSRPVATVPQRDPPGQDDHHPDGPGPSQDRDDPLPAPVEYRPRMPSVHHAAASAAALSAFPQHQATASAGLRDSLREMQDNDADDIAQVQENLRALRSRVEHYAKLRAGGQR
ncbi:GumC family protein [Pararhizobium polonicum]|uniref:GumC family protein n=1 Tax=Pararhizobium polonicum TaxID=1612624 RepID=UPI00083A056D|nr:GumC family protein [Pararhizobium polonicum]